MPRRSAGLLMYRWRQDQLEVFLVHPGGPYWTRKDDGAWSIPKGEFTEDEEPEEAARREFHEETGFHAQGRLTALEPVRQPGGKTVMAWAVEGDCPPDQIRSNTFSMEWPPGSKKQQEFPEIDRAAWFTLEAASEKLSKAQCGLLDQLRHLLDEQRIEGG